MPAKHEITISRRRLHNLPFLQIISSCVLISIWGSLSSMIFINARAKLDDLKKKKNSLYQRYQQYNLILIIFII